MCDHTELTIDAFATLPGVRRAVPGNAICAKCQKPLPYYKGPNDKKFVKIDN